LSFIARLRKLGRRYSDECLLNRVGVIIFTHIGEFAGIIGFKVHTKAISQLLPVERALPFCSTPMAAKRLPSALVVRQEVFPYEIIFRHVSFSKSQR